MFNYYFCIYNALCCKRRGFCTLVLHCKCIDMYNSLHIELHPVSVGEMVLWLLPLVPVYSWYGASFDVAGLNVLKPLQADIVEEKEGLLTDSLALVKKMTVCFLPLYRSAHVVTLKHRRLKSVSYDLAHDQKIKLITTQFGKRGSEGAIVLNMVTWLVHCHIHSICQHSRIRASSWSSKLLCDTATSHTSDSAPLARLAVTMSSAVGVCLLSSLELRFIGLLIIRLLNVLIWALTIHLYYCCEYS